MINYVDDSNTTGKGQKFINRGEKIQEVSIILKGKVAMRTKMTNSLWKKGRLLD